MAGKIHTGYDKGAYFLRNDSYGDKIKGVGGKDILSCFRIQFCIVFAGICELS